MGQKNIYIYLARRDKKGIQVLYVFQGMNRKIHPNKIENIAQFNLPIKIQSSIEKSIKDNRMLWEPWVESSDSFQDLKNSLKKRGYKNLPVTSFPKFKESSSSIFFGKKDQKRNYSFKNLKETKTMLRKRKN